jgi:hypothetical protein
MKNTNLVFSYKNLIIFLAFSFYIFLFNYYVIYSEFINSTESVIRIELKINENGVDKYIPIKYLGNYQFSTTSDIFCKVSQIKRYGANNINHLIDSDNIQNKYLINQYIPAPSFLNCSGILGDITIVIFKK